MAKLIKLNPLYKESENKEKSSYDDAINLLQKELGIDINDEDFQYYSEIVDDEDWDDDNEFDDEGYMFGMTLPKQKFIGTSKREFHIRIKLNNAPVNIWRELVVPSNITLELLAFVLLDAMGWKHEHLYHFRGKDNVFYVNSQQLKEQEDFMGFFSRSAYKNSEETSLEMVLQPKAASKREQGDASIGSAEQEQALQKVAGGRMKFEYDFGDSWEHDLWVKGARDYAPNEEPVIRLLKAHGECPPEDCGGVWGYADLLELSKKKRKSAEDKEQLEWFGIPKGYDPEDCNLEWLQGDIDALWLDIKDEM